MSRHPMKYLSLGLLFALLAVASIGHADSIYCGQSLAPCTTSAAQGNVLLNSQTTGAATTAVTVTLAASTGTRSHVYSVSARCNTAAATGDLTITDGGVTVWTSGPLAVIAAQPQYRTEWATPLTGAVSSAVVITLSACTAGTGTLIVQADRY